MLEQIKTLFSDLFLFNPDEPLIFSAPLFWGFFAVVMLVYQFVYKHIFYRNLFLTVFSFFFYYKAGGYFFTLLILSTLIDYYAGKGIAAATKKSTKKLFLIISLVANLGLLFYFKYTFFFLDASNQLLGTNYQVVNMFSVLINNLAETFDFLPFVDATVKLDTTSIILPVGISFYTFQTMSYSLDIYKEELKPVHNIWDFAFFVTFFPQLVAGPIVRASDFIPQIYEKYQLTKQQFNYAIFLIINGLVKKMLISDYISAQFVDQVFLSPDAYGRTGFEVLMATYGYAIQIYCDFSGYTDIAIGISVLLGFYLPLNFNSPYKSDSITDFWRRWHISLSSWLKDYLYISLGGNRTISLFTYISIPLILLVFLLIDGFYIADFAFFAIIIAFWLFSIMFPYKNLAAIIGLFFITFFMIKLGQDADLFYIKQLGFAINAKKSYYTMIMLGIVAAFWIFLLIYPQKKYTISTYMNLSLTMLLGGLWHGAHIKFIIWGALHGGALALHKFWMDVTGSHKWKGKYLKYYIFLMQIVTFHFVCFCWLYFRADDVNKVNTMLNLIFTNFQPQLFVDVCIKYWNVFSVILFGFMVHFLPISWKNYVRIRLSNTPDWAKAVGIALIIFMLFQVKTVGTQAFIYFQF